MKIGFAGFGKVGKGIHNLFWRTEHETYIYDPNIPYSVLKKDFPTVDVLFICVPTPARKDGTCDTSIVEETIDQFEAGIYVIRSTVWVGFTDAMKYKHKKKEKRIVFMPEYGPSDFPNHPFNEISKIPWAVLGGTPHDTEEIASLWQELLYNVKIFHTQAATAELLKLVENAYFYSKLSFFNVVYDIVRACKLDYDEIRMMLTEDPRIEADHSFIKPSKRKIGGPCLPKDLENLIWIGQNNDVDVSLLKLMKKLNSKRR